MGELDDSKGAVGGEWLCEEEVQEGFGGDEAGVEHVHTLGIASVKADGEGIRVEARLVEEDICAVIVEDEELCRGVSRCVGKLQEDTGHFVGVLVGKTSKDPADRF